MNRPYAYAIEGRVLIVFAITDTIILQMKKNNLHIKYRAGSASAVIIYNYMEI